MTADRTVVVTIFTKPGCGLCEEAEEVIEAVRARRSFAVERRNILDNSQDYDRYKHDIPVILLDGVEIARHHLSEQVLLTAINTTPSPGTRQQSPSVAATPASPSDRARVQNATQASPLREVEEQGARGVAERSDAGAAPEVEPRSAPGVALPSPQPSPRSTGKSEQEDPAIIIMARYPTPGRVKTRLMPALSADDAARVHREFLLHLIRRLSSHRVIACYDPPELEADMRHLLGASIALIPQSPGDLGERLAAATIAARRSAQKLIFLGVDSPDVPVRFISHVAELLASHDVVIALAEDGGYWAVAVSPRVDAAKLFAGIEWSSGREGAQTLERARHLGYNVAVADRWADVDRPDDLRRLIERLKRSNEADDRQLLARLSFLPDGAL